jgi:metal-sulfur cluster biosynthetic enzyme
MSTALADAVLDALDSVSDPCSIATRRPLSIVELGLLVDLDVGDEGDVRVTLRATSPSCMLIGSIMQAAEERIAAVGGVRGVEIELDPSSDWTPDRMTSAGRAKLESARARAARRLARRAARPHALGAGPGAA